MSRIAKKPIDIPEEVTVKVDGDIVTVTGPLGEAHLTLPKQLKAAVVGAKLEIKRKGATKLEKSLQGTVARRLKNMVVGAREGWSKTLELVGTGYRARLEGPNLVLAIGFSHPVTVAPPPGIVFEIEEAKIRVKGLDRELVGQVAANIRRLRPPEPYKGTGIKYEEEIVRRKPGKAVKVGVEGGTA